MAKQPTRKPTAPKSPPPKGVPLRKGGGNKGVIPPPRRPKPPKK
jgi:hypothetical protein